MADKNTSLAAPTQQGPNVAFVRVELADVERQYDVIRDCIAGSETIKKRGDKYLSRPNAADTSPENQARYEAYKKRAVFYNVARRTLAGLVGQVFLRDPVCEVPPIMDIIKTDATGSGVTLDQIALMATNDDCAYGRVGMLTDYPDVDIPATAADLAAGTVRPTILIYPSWDIINWREIVVKGKVLKSLIVIRESVLDDDDGFEQSFKDQWRVLSLVNGIYQVQLWEKFDSGFTVAKTYFPKDAKGKNLNEIPFTFVGVYNNDASPDAPPMYDLVEINLAHYRNSADYEESCFLVGQPTPIITGLTEDWVKTVMHGTVELGSRAAVPLPVGGDAKLLQALPNSMPKEAMDAKERQMVALGAKLVEQKTVQRTLGEAELENTAEISILASIAKNVQIAMTFSLVWCARFMGADETQVKYELNTEFDMTQLDPTERQELIAEWKAGAISFDEMREGLRRAGVATHDAKAIREALAQDKKDGLGPLPPPPIGHNGGPPLDGNTPPNSDNATIPGTPAA